MKRDNQDIRLTPITGPVTLSADNTSAAIDLVDAASNKIAIVVGAGGITFSDTNRIDIKITHSDDDSTYTAVGQNDVIINGDDDNLIVDAATGNVKAYTAAHASADVVYVDYIGNKRYIKVFTDFSGTHGTGTPVTVLLVQSRLHLAGTTA